MVVESVVGGVVKSVGETAAVVKSVGDVVEGVYDFFAQGVGVASKAPSSASIFVVQVVAVEDVGVEGLRSLIRR
jgi:hypothetical protein